MLNLEDGLNEYIRLLKDREYFNAHEILEEVWHPLRKSNHPLKNLVKGLINASIAFEHIKRNREKSMERAKRVIVSYERYKDICREGIELYQLFSKAIFIVEDIKRGELPRHKWRSFLETPNYCSDIKRL